MTQTLTRTGHDTSVTVAGKWTRTFLEPLLTNKNFMKNTLVLVTFDENHTYGNQNRVVAILLGDAVPTSLVGTSDSSYYNHYSEIATVQANWCLNTLGRWDVGANVFKLVAEKTGDAVRKWAGKVPLSQMFFNESYAGKLNDEDTSPPWPVPNTTLVHAGRKVAPVVVNTWGKLVAQSAYTTALEIPDGMHPDAEFK
jgi:acid phosphatase